MTYEIDKMIANSEKLICQECQSKNQTSTVKDLGSTTTCVAHHPFYDEEGKRHHHDGNVVMTSFICSRNHSFAKQRLNGCWCGWKQKPKQFANE